MADKRSRKWLWALVAVLVLGFAAIFYLFSATGAATVYGWITTSHLALPAAEQRGSAWGDRFLQLAGWRGALGDEVMARTMWLEFCGATADGAGKTVFDTGKLDGKYCTPDGQTGWGPLHPRAPDAFMNYLESYEVVNSSQWTAAECVKYYKLFYTWHIRHSPTKKPHPQFNKHWAKVKLLYTKARQPWPADVDATAPLAEPWREE